MAEPVEKLVSGGELAEQPRLSAEEGWALFESMKGMWAGQMEEYGGEEEFIRKLRSDEPIGLP